MDVEEQPDGEKQQQPQEDQEQQLEEGTEHQSDHPENLENRETEEHLEEQSEQHTEQEVKQKPDWDVLERLLEHVEEEPEENVEELPVDNVEEQPKEEVEEHTGENVEEQPEENEEQQPVDNVEEQPENEVVEQPDENAENYEQQDEEKTVDIELQSQEEPEQDVATHLGDEAKKQLEEDMQERVEDTEEQCGDNTEEDVEEDVDDKSQELPEGVERPPDKKRRRTWLMGPMYPKDHQVPDWQPPAITELSAVPDRRRSTTAASQTEMTDEQIPRQEDFDLYHNTGEHFAGAARLRWPTSSDVVPEPPCVVDKGHTVIVRFVYGRVHVLTRSVKMHTTVREMKIALARTYRVPATNIILARQMVDLEDGMRLDQMGVKPFHVVTLDLVIPSDEELEEPPLEPETESEPEPRLITVVVLLDDEDPTTERHVRVEIHDHCICEPYLGGYRDKRTGTEYHHGYSQTQPRDRRVAACNAFHRDTQTVRTTDWTGNSCTHRATQMWRRDHFIPSDDDRLMTSRPYVPASVREELVLAAVLVLQRNLRKWLARKVMHARIHTLRNAIMAYGAWKTQKDEQMAKWAREQLMVHTYPCTLVDFENLYGLLEQWRQAEIERITATRSGGAKKAELCALLEKEINVLTILDQHRDVIKKDQVRKKELQLITQCSEPVKWTGYKGLVISMDTMETQRGRELADLYYTFCNYDVTLEERVEFLVSMKYSLRVYNYRHIHEIVALLDRECELLVHGVSPSALDFLRKRTGTLLLQFFRSPIVNRQTRRVLGRKFDAKTAPHRLVTCGSCGQLKKCSQFVLSGTEPRLRICLVCSWRLNVSHRRVDLALYAMLLRMVRRDERRRHSYSSVAFVMNPEEMRYLVERIWGGRSVFGQERDLPTMRLPRWESSRDWAPWNCVLLTDKEAMAHSMIDVNSTYHPWFREIVEQRHAVALMYFRQLARIDQDVRLSGAWFQSAPQPKYVAPPPECEEPLQQEDL